MIGLKQNALLRDYELRKWSNTAECSEAHRMFSALNVRPVITRFRSLKSNRDPPWNSHSDGRLVKKIGSGFTGQTYPRPMAELLGARRADPVVSKAAYNTTANLAWRF